MSHIDDFNRELVRQIAGAFNGVEIRPLNVDQAADCLSSAQERGDQFEQIVRLVNGLRALGWIVCPPLPGICRTSAGPELTGRAGPTTIPLVVFHNAALPVAKR